MRRLFFIVLFCLLFISCNRVFEEPIRIADFMLNASQWEGGAFNSNEVSIKDVMEYAKVTFPKTKGEKSFIVIPLVDDLADTLIFVIKFEKGFRLVSSDKRVPPILAENDESDYDSWLENESRRHWINMMAADMKVIKATPDQELLIPLEEQNQYRAFWDSYGNIDSFISSYLPETKIEEFPDLSGYYYIYSDETQNELYDYVNHLTQTSWHQLDPFNAYCPAISSVSSTKAPAGCVAIAGAQMLYYLHYKLGVPATAPTQAYCNSYVGQTLDMGQSNYTATVWDSMAVYPLKAAPLIANIGLLVNMDYGVDGSGADISDLRTIAFPEYGIDCGSTLYTEGIVRGSILNDMPLIIGAAGGYYMENGHTVYYNRHAFILDGYQRHRTKRTIVYRWQYSQPSPLPRPEVADSVVITTSYPDISYVRMNWGWGDSYDNTWYAFTGDWYVGTDNFNNNSRIALHSFCAIEE